MKLTYNTAIQNYIALRDKISEIDKAASEKKAELRKVMVDIEVWVDEHASKDGLKNVNTDFGTAFWGTRHQATIADSSAFMDYVIGNERWDLLEKRVSRSAVKADVAETGEVPPGINYGQVRTFNVRRVNNSEGK
jgi:hypothetical protein